MDGNLRARPWWAGAVGDRAPEDFSDLGLRDDIHLSWQRSQQALAPMDKVDVPFVELDDDDHRLLRLVEPVLVRFAGHLADTRFSLVLADRDGRVVHTFAGENSVRSQLAALSIDTGYVLSEECAGTNGVGTVLEEQRPVLVVGDEHYSEPLRGLTCAGTPIRNPISGRLEGVLDLACPRGEWSKLIAPALEQLRHDVEAELAAKASMMERLIFERFTTRCRETSAAVAGVSDQYMITNAAAANLLAPADQAVIWTALSQHEESSTVHGLTLSNGSTIDATSQVIRVGGTVRGHLVELTPHHETTPHRAQRRRTPVPFETSIGQVVDTNPRRLLIIGEGGTGKVATAQRLHASLNATRPLTTMSCELARVADGRTWLAELAVRLQDPVETIILRHVDLLPAPVAQAVAALLNRHEPVIDPYAPHGGGSHQASAADREEGNPPTGPWIYATASSQFADGWAGLREALGEQILHVPPVREKRAQLPTVAATMLKDINPNLHISGRALAALQNYDWPGNFTQLRSVLATSANNSGGHLIGFEHLPRDIAGALRGPQALSRIEELEREAIIAALREEHGNKVRAAEALGMSRSTFYRRLRQLRLDPSVLLA